MLSVITPTFNGMSKGLGRSINSVLQIDLVQEYIIIVDGSNDSSYEFCNDLKKKDSRIKLISNNNNLGWTYSVSKAIDSISNKWITIHNDDDWLLPNFNNLINFTSQNDLDLCYSKYAIGNDQKKKIELFYNPAWPKESQNVLKQEFYNLLLNDCYIGRCIIKTEKFSKLFEEKRIRKIEKNFGDSFTAFDFECYLQMTVNDDKFGFLNEVCSVWTKRNAQQTGHHYVYSGKSAAENSFLFNSYFNPQIHSFDWNYLNKVFQRVKSLFLIAKSNNNNLNKNFEKHFLLFSKNIQQIRETYV